MAGDGTGRIRSVSPGYWGHWKTLAAMEHDRALPGFFVGVWHMADDEGRFVPDPRSLRVNIMPTARGVNDNTVARWLDVLEEIGFIHRYQVGGRTYAVCHDWHQWQKPKYPTRSHRPAPPKDLCPCCLRRFCEYPEEASPNPPPTLPQPSRSGVESSGVESSKEGGIEAPAPDNPAPAGDEPCCELGKPLEANANAPWRTLKACHDRYQAARQGRCPTQDGHFSPKRDLGIIATLLGQMRQTPDRIATAYTGVLGSVGRMALERGPTIPVLKADYGAYLQAATEGYTHGHDRSGNNGGSPRRRPQTAASAAAAAASWQHCEP